MAKKVFLQDQNEKLLPITRGELVLDSSGKEAFHSSEFLANNSQPGLMSEEDKITLDLLKVQSTPIIFGQSTDTEDNWTGVSDQITEYYEGLRIIYIPKKQGTHKTAKLQLNELDAKRVTVVGQTSKFLANAPILLIYTNGKWVHNDKDTTYTMPYGLYIVTFQAGTLFLRMPGEQPTLNLNTPQYFILCVPTTWNCQHVYQAQIWTSDGSYQKVPCFIDGQKPIYTYTLRTGHYIAYYDGESLYINTDGTIPGKIEKAKIAETVEWNEVEGDNEDVSIGESSVTNSLYLYTHNLTNVSKKPSEYKNQYLTALFSKTDMPITQTCSGINISSSSTNVNWQLCSQASNTYDRAYDRLWFRSGIGESWNPWQQVAFIHDLNTFKVKQDPVEDPTAEGVSTTFIDSISQDENGKITVTKKTVQNTGGTSQSIPVASETDLGGIRLGYVTDSASRNYKVQVNQTGDAYVNVPWVSGESGDTKNTAGATNNESDLFIIGSLDQSDNPQTYSNANIKISGNAIKASGGFYQESDERLKDFKDDIQVDLEQLSKLPKKKFTWKNAYTKETHIGTSAQEVQKLYPELVKEDSDGTLSVAYDKLSIIALKAIDELYQRNIQLEKRIQELEKK